MTDRPVASAFRWLVLIVAAVVACAEIGRAQEPAYIFEDVYLGGKEICTFTDGGQNVSVVLGDFKLRLGQRQITGRDAVLWIDSKQVGEATRYDITVYVEGDKAEVVEPSGAVTSDKTLLVTLHTDGRIIAESLMAQRDLRDFPLYRRAVDVRAEASRLAKARAAGAEAAGQIAREPVTVHKPALIEAESQSAASEPIAPAASQPTEPVAGRPMEGATTEPAAELAASQPVVAAPAEPNTPKPPVKQPVTFRCDEFSSELVGEKGQQVRVTIARGNIYLSQGSPDSDQFLELRGQAAVIFSQRLDKDFAKDARNPLAVNLAAGKENITGVYLENDVILSRGNRYFRGDRLYYDFMTDRAIIMDPVFRTVQEQRNIPIYVRAREARLLSAKEVYFQDAKVSTSDFYSPSYHIGGTEAWLVDKAPYDEKGVRIGPEEWQSTIKNATYNVSSVPLLYWPYSVSDFERGNTALRKVSVGSFGDLGTGVETDWHLFRLLGLLEPEGFDATLGLNEYQRGTLAQIDMDYNRPTYSGYSRLSGLLDREQKDTFGNDVEDIPAPAQRGWALMRHKQFLPDDWQVQAELSYLCDRNYLQEFYPSEYFAGKEQETLLYVKKQRDNWAVTGLGQVRINRFLTQTESAPDISGFLIGQPLADDRATYFNESRIGVKRYRPDDGNAALGPASDLMGRFDTRNEVDLPAHVGPVNATPYAMGRGTVWTDAPDGGEYKRAYGQTGVRTNTQFWRLYNNAQSRLWDVNRLKHIITPEVDGFLADTNAQPDQLFPMDPDIEKHLERQSGVVLNLFQRLQTKRGPVGHERTVDWMRLDLSYGAYSNGSDTQRSDGRFFFYRPEYSIGRNHLNGDYTWNISDATAILADVNYDVDRAVIGRSALGVAVSRDPRLQYYAGWRYINDLDSSVGTLAMNYKLTTKYSVSFVEQYDFLFAGGSNLVSQVQLVRKLPRWYAGFTFLYAQGQAEGDNVGLMLSFWPEGVPEFRIETGRFNVLGKSTQN